MPFNRRAITKELDNVNLQRHNDNYTDIETELDTHDNELLAANQHIANGAIHTTQAEKDKLTGIQAQAEVNQNAFSKVSVVGQSDVDADSKTDTLTMEGGTGITITTDPASDKVIFTATGTATPGAHASSHVTGGADVIPDAVASGNSGLMSGADKTAHDQTVTQMYNVLGNGLVGGGTTNDTAALQTLINTAIAAGRKAIYFPHGTNGQYKVTALTNANQVVFFGDNASFVGGYTGTINQIGDSGSAASGYNALINGNFAVNQEVKSGTVVLSAGAYGHDMWKAGSAGCTYTFVTVNNVTTITITAGSLLQIIEGINLFSGTYTLSWTGTAQGKIGAGSYGVSGITGTAVGGTNLTIEFNTGTLSLVQFSAGGVALPFQPRSLAEELALCQRFYYKTFNINTAPAQNIGIGHGELIFQSTGSGYGTSVQWKFPVRMRTIPTITTYNPAAANSSARNMTLAADVQTTTPVADSDQSVWLGVGGTNTTGVGERLGVHIVANARL
jgi:hypothetical protein